MEKCQPIKRSTENDAVCRNHSSRKCTSIALGLSLCITVDILQYSMPLAFLPSVLEDRGHSSMKIATALGVYYWTGFAGGALITLYKVWHLIFSGAEEETTSLATAKNQIRFLIYGLLLGSLTLLWQAFSPHCWVHTTCRFIQGLSGSFLFFYTFLLSVSLFKGQQQVFAMTCASIALNVAEVLGSFCGAMLFAWWGQRSVFGFLGIVSFINQFVLVAIMRSLTTEPRETEPPSSDAPSGSAEALLLRGPDRIVRPPQFSKSGSKRLLALLTNTRMFVATLLITMAAVVKGSVEEMLPFHADHQWGYEPIVIGEMFFVIAVAYIGAAICAGKVWQRLEGSHVAFSALWLSLLGGAAWCVFAAASYHKDGRLLMIGLVLYGICLGLTHTPAALMLADTIEQEEGAAKDAANGIWNTMWEAGGSLGFLFGGFLADDYASQFRLMSCYAVCCVCCAALMLTVGWRVESKTKLIGDKDSQYGSVV